MARPYTEKERKKMKKAFLEALEESMGMMTTSAERAGTTRETIDNWRKADPDFDKAINDIKEKQKEFVYGQLMTAIRNGNVASIMFFLKCQCHWHETQRLEVEQTGDLDITAAINEIRKELAGNGNS